MILIRLVWVALTQWLRNLRVPPERRMPWAHTVIIGWTGMRGVVTLAAAFIIPSAAPHRGELHLVALVVVLGTLFLQGLTLPLLARVLGVQSHDPAVDALARATLLQQAGEAGLERLKELAPEDEFGVVEVIRARVDQRSFAAWERLSTTVGETPSELTAYQVSLGEGEPPRYTGPGPNPELPIGRHADRG